MPVQSGFRQGPQLEALSPLRDQPTGQHRSRSRASPHGPERETRLGSGGAPARPTLPHRAKPTVSQQPASGRRGCLGASHRGGDQEAPGSSERPEPPARPPSHTVSQQHQSRLAWPHSAVVDRHRPSWAGGAGEGARRPLPMEWRMSIEASRSVLSRDWALWNSTTAAAAILPLSHSPRPRPPTPETHARKAHPRGSPVSPHLPRLLHSQSTTGVVVSPRGGEGGM